MEIICAYKNLFDKLVTKGLKLQFHHLDNEAFKTVQQFLNKHDVSYQLTPPHTHHHNAVIHAIKKFKNCFITGLASTDPHFPLYHWDKPLPQALLSLNLLHQSCLTPNPSAYAQLYGNFDYKKTSPPCIRIVAHTKSFQCNTWAPHGQEGLYLGPAMSHYCCYMVQIQESKLNTSLNHEILPTPLQDAAPILGQPCPMLCTSPNPFHHHPATAFPDLSSNQLNTLSPVATIFHSALPGVEGQ